MDTNHIKSSEFSFESPNTIKIVSWVLTLIFVAGLCFNIYTIYVYGWSWNWKTILFSACDILIITFFLTILSLAMRQNNLPTIAAIYPPAGREPQDFPDHAQLEKYGCEFSGVIILKFTQITNYLEVYINRDKSWFFIRAMNEVYGNKSLEYIAGSFFHSPSACITVTNATRPQYILPAIKEQFSAVLTAADPAQVIKLHLRLLEESKWHMISPKKLDINQVADSIVEMTRLNVEYQHKKHLMKRVSTNDYRLTLTGCVYTTIHCWYYLNFELDRKFSTERWCQLLHQRFNHSLQISNSLKK